MTRPAVTLHMGDCLDVLRQMPEASVDAVVTDPPYGLSFMGKRWDYDVPAVEVWAECLRVLKPGGHLLAFAGTRTQHRMAVRIEDAGFEIRDLIAWVYGSGFPKSLDVSKAIDRHGGNPLAWREFARAYAAAVSACGMSHADIDRILGVKSSSCYWARLDHRGGMPPRQHWEKLCAVLLLPAELSRLYDEAEREVVGQRLAHDLSKDRPVAIAAQGKTGTARAVIDITAPATDAARQWHGWGTALKPALEPITVARKPLAGTVAETVLAYGTGAINVDGCRVDGSRPATTRGAGGQHGRFHNIPAQGRIEDDGRGRWPSNLIHDGGADVTDLLGDAARFFYTPKASRADRDAGCDGLPQRTAAETVERAEGSAGLDSPRAGAGRTSGSRNHHPTVKPTDLMRYLCRLVTRPGGVVLDPFMGSGSTGRGAVLEGFAFVGIEREADYLTIAQARIEAAQQEAQAERPQLSLFDQVFE